MQDRVDAALRYQLEVLGDRPPSVRDHLAATVASAVRSVSVTIFVEPAAPDVMEVRARPRFNSLTNALTVFAGGRADPFASIVRNSDNVFIRMLPPGETAIWHLMEPNMAGMVTAIADLSAQNDHFAFAVSLFHEANGERHPHYALARYYSVLEALAYKLKGYVGNPTLKTDSAKRGSRKAISYMLLLADIHRSRISIRGKVIEYDEIELARLVRDHLFHGVEVEEKDYPGVPAATWELLRTNPEHVLRDLRSHCEIEIRRWAIDTSIARVVAEGRASGLSPDHPALRNVRPFIGGSQASID